MFLSLGIEFPEGSRLRNLTHKPSILIGINMIWWLAFFAVGLFIPYEYQSEFVYELAMNWARVIFPLVPFGLLVMELEYRIRMKRMMSKEAVNPDSVSAEGSQNH
jgi:hypothetical protein